MQPDGSVYEIDLHITSLRDEEIQAYTRTIIINRQRTRMDRSEAVTVYHSSLCIPWTCRQVSSTHVSLVLAAFIDTKTVFLE